SLLINRDAVDCSGRRMSDVLIGKRKQLRSYWRAVVKFALRCVGGRGEARSPRVVVAHAFFPSKPYDSSLIGQQVHLFEALRARESQRAGTNEQHMVGPFHHKL